MAFFIDQKYLELVGHRLPLFTKKKGDLYNCRCIICGDSTTNKHKARGYFYRADDKMMYKCHNCDVTKSFRSFLKILDPIMYQEYVHEMFVEKGEPRPVKEQKEPEMLFAAVPQFEPRLPLDKIAERLDELPDDHEAIAYCKKRKIPLAKWKKIYYLSRTADITRLFPQYKEDITGGEPRLVFPFVVGGKMVGATLRALDGRKLRYLIVKEDDDVPNIYGLESVDPGRDVLVVEGPIDSLFLKNAIACAGTSFGKIDSLDIPKDNIVVVADNQPRNIDVAKIVDKYIKLGFRVCIWPPYIREKDINDMVLAGVDVERVIHDHTFHGPRAVIEFSRWRKSK